MQTETAFSRDATRRFASPLSRVLARREGLDLADLSGTGPHGRVVKADVMEALNARGAGGGSARADAQSVPSFDTFPNSIGRKLIARRLTESKHQAPHFYVRMDCDVGALQLWRTRRAAVDGQKLSVNDFVIKAAALSLKDVPGVNASYTEPAIRRYHQVNISVAIALDDGLVTPVIEDADRKTLGEIARTVKDFSTRARAGKLEPGASRGGTFSISNLGSYGVREFAAVINPPQGAILAVGAAQARAVVQDGQLVIAHMMSVTLSVDHRAIDGAVAARWLAAFKRYVEDPASLDAVSSSVSAV